jgi:quercetin dioxygenase-like cupin family protein
MTTTVDLFTQLPPGQAVIVPSGRWHRVELDEPTEILVVTVRRGTQLEDVSPGTDTQDEAGSCGPGPRLIGGYA